MTTNPIYINSLHLVGYKSIRDATISFQAGLNIVIGKNGSGKTNLLDFLDIVISSNVIYYHHLDYDLDYDNFLINFSVNEENRSLKAIKANDKIDVKLDDDNFQISLIESDDTFLFANALNKIFAKKENRLIVFNIPKGKVNLSLLENPLSVNIKLNGYSELASQSYHAFLLISLFFLFLYKKIKSEKQINAIKDLLQVYFLEFIEQNNILKNLQKFSPIEDLRISPNINVYPQGFDNELSIQNIYIEFLLNGRWQSWQMLSDGTKRLFYLITEVTLTNGIVLLEEPELGVHPHQLHQIMLFLKEQAEDKQIILTTHSPQVLDVLNSDELDRIIIAEVHKEKGSQFRHLDEKTTAKAKYYLEDEGFLSDFWRYSTLEPREVL